MHCVFKIATERQAGLGNRFVALMAIAELKAMRIPGFT